MITLAVGRLEVDWGKNTIYTDHGELFQPCDLKDVPSYYASDDWPDGDPIIVMNEGFGKPLGLIVDRLELLGYTMRAVEHQYSELHRLHGVMEPPISYSELKDALARVDVSKFSGNYGEDYGPGEFVREEILTRLLRDSERPEYSDAGLRPDFWEVGLLLENLESNCRLRLLAENPKNHNLDVSWDFGELVDSGWVARGEFKAGARSDQQFLVVTEGSSDSKIIEHALRLYRPHVTDFFRFVDMEEGYPFSGTGNLYRFAQGLVSIGIQNNLVIVYDNDAEGLAQLGRTKQLNLPENIRAIGLPDLSSLSNFDTIGPDGAATADINGKAAAIECYLDLASPRVPAPIVRWTVYNRETSSYHGVLREKTRYMKDFLRLRGPDPTYRSDKIEAVIDVLIAECVSIAEVKHFSSPVRRDIS